MPDTASKLADKLTSEGEKTLAFFKELPDNAWTRQIFADGAQWDVRGVFEHLCISEHLLRRLFEQILATGHGVPEGFDVNAFNQEKTGRFASNSRNDMLQLYADTRAKTVVFTQGLSDEQLVMRGRHPGIGDATLEEQIKLVYLHHAMHVRDVKKALTSP
jgi:hypothetical protein